MVCTISYGRLFPLIAGAILSGGASRRMGHDKSTQVLGAKSLLHHVVEAVRPQVSHLIVVGGNRAGPESMGLTVIEDTLPGRRGPLAGILSAMEWFGKNNSAVEKVFVTAIDMPFLPSDIVDQLTAKMSGAQSIFPIDGGRRQFMAGLWNLELRQDLRKGLGEGDVASVKSFVENHASREITLEPDARNPKPFFNVNTAEDLQAAQLLMQSD